MNINPRLAYIPDFLINFTVKRVIYMIIGRMASKELFEKFYKDKKLEEKKEFYDRIKNLLREFVNVPDDDEE
jgi:hypothetical protein